MYLRVPRSRRKADRTYEDLSDDVYTTFAACCAIHRIENSKRFDYVVVQPEWPRIRRAIPRLFWETRESVREGCNDVVARRSFGKLEVQCTFLASEEWQINIYRRLV